jgi:hypothetical protein
MSQQLTRISGQISRTYVLEKSDICRSLFGEQVTLAQATLLHSGLSRLQHLGHRLQRLFQLCLPGEPMRSQPQRFAAC